MGSSGPARAGIIAVLLLAGVAGAIIASQMRRGPRPVQGGAGNSGTQPVPDAVFGCGSCHGIPPPSALPKEKWANVIHMMNERIVAYGLTPAPSEAHVKEAIAYYTNAAPETLAALPQRQPASSLTFTGSGFGNAPVRGPGPPPVIGCIKIVDLDGNKVPEVLACDTREGNVLWLARLPDGKWVEQLVGRAPFPAHVEAADLDGDKIPEIIFSYLGGLTPTDELLGGVVVVRNDGKGNVSATVAANNIARTSDVRPADLDGDGDIDLAVAMFGMYAQGGIGWLERNEKGEYALRTLETISGVSHVPVGDLNGDNRPDIVALVSQHHERIIVCANRGNGNFERRVVYQAPHPLWGCSGAELVDLNKDGRLDILFTNGDALDFDTAPKPYHGVQWLENLGDMKFQYHDIMRFYGAYRAVAADLDGDGDMDIAVCSMSAPWRDEDAQSLIWLENDGNQSFTPRAISNSPTYLVSMDVGDLNSDGTPDILTGGMYVLQPYGRVGRMTLFANGGRAR